MPSDFESEVVIVQTNHGLVYAVSVPPQSFEESRSNTLEHVPLISAGCANELAETARLG